MKLITREHVKVDRVACPRLIKKFVDKDAEFHLVPSDQVMNEAKRLEATHLTCPESSWGTSAAGIALGRFGNSGPRLCRRAY